MMVEDAMSLCSSPVSEERSLVLHLILITFAGEEIQLTIELQEFDRLNEFENAVLEQLPYIGERAAPLVASLTLSIKTPAKC